MPIPDKLLIGLLAVSAVTIIGCERTSRDNTGPAVTMAEYESIQTGMSYKQVVGILGKDGTEMSRSDLAGYTTVMYMWKGAGGANMNAMFQNDKLITKAQFGLK